MSRASVTPCTAADLGDLTGRSFLVTGANSGLGLATTRELARHGADVILAVRDVAAGEAARTALRAELGAPRLEVCALDLIDLGSVRRLASALVAERRPIDVLVLNAGIGAQQLVPSPEGIESTFATNHLGHFALAGLLLEHLAERPAPRVVTVSSGFIKRGGRIDFDNLTGERGFSAMRAYVRSKLANAMFGFELDRRLRAAGSPIRSIVAHPGVAATAMHTKARGAARIAAWLVSKLVAKSADVGARAVLYAATAPELTGGEFIGPGGHVRPAAEPPGPSSADPAVWRQLWEVSAALTGVTPKISAPHDHPTLTAAARWRA